MTEDGLKVIELRREIVELRVHNAELQEEVERLRDVATLAERKTQDAGCALDESVRSYGMGQEEGLQTALSILGESVPKGVERKIVALQETARLLAKLREASKLWTRGAT